MPPDWLDQAPVTKALLALNIGVFALEVALSRGLSPPRAAVQLQLGGELRAGHHRRGALGDARHRVLPPRRPSARGLQHAGPLAGGPAGRAHRGLGAHGADVPGRGRVREPAQRRLRWLVRGQTRSAPSPSARRARSRASSRAALVARLAHAGVARARHPGDGSAGWGSSSVFGLLSNFERRQHRQRGAHRGRYRRGRHCAPAGELRHQYPDGATRAVLGACVAVVAACIAVLSVREATNPFAIHARPGSPRPSPCAPSPTAAAATRTTACCRSSAFAAPSTRCAGRSR